MSPAVGVGNRPISPRNPYESLAGLAAVLTQAHGGGTVHERLTQGLDYLCQALGASGAWVSLRGEESSQAPNPRIVAAYGLPQESLVRRHAPQEVERGFAHREIYRSGHGPRQASLLTCRCPNGKNGAEAGSWYCVDTPIEKSGAPIGQLSLAFSCKPALNAEQRAMLKLAAGLLAEALGQAGAAVLSPESQDTGQSLRGDNAPLQEALKFSSREYELILQSAGEGICGLDRSGKITFVNPAAASMLGYQPHELIGAAQHELFHHSRADGSPRPREECSLCSALADGSRIHCEEDVFWRKDGTGVPVEYTCAPMYDGRQLKGAVVIFRDTSQRKELERQRQQIIEDTPDFVATTDPEGRILYFNKAARRMLGFGMQEDVTGVRIQDIHPEGVARTVMEEALPAAIRRGTWHGETVLQSKDGRRIPVSQVIIAHKDGAGKVRYFSTIARDITERKQMEARLEYLASHDFLTGILNRARFQEELERELARARRYGTSGTLIFLDLDNFKDINDTLGHQAGDQVLRRVAQVLRSRLRSTDILARLGGDEFVVLLPHTSVSDARIVGEAILERLRQEVTEVDGRLIRLRASLGIVAYPDQGEQVEDLLIGADMTMYEAKRAGGHRISVATGVEEGRREREFRLCWERRITEALHHEGFVLYRQPVVSLADGRLAGYELLLRMKDGPDELVLPHEFLPVAERTGLMIEIDRWVLQRALQLLARSSEDDGSLFVNLSGMAFSDDDFFALVQEQLQQVGAGAQRLVIELTETGVIRNFSHAGKFIQALRESTGCRFALDDFGKGFSSLWALRDLDVDFLKIDGGFVRDLLCNAVDQHIVRAIVNMARGLGKRTVAEYIPDATTLDLLREWGVDWGQGYHVGRPEPVPDLDEVYR